MSTGKRILFIITSHDQLGNTGKKTGYYVSELVHPYLELSPLYHIDFASPKGGPVPADPSSVEAFQKDSALSAYNNDTKLHEALKNTRKLSEFVGKESDYAAIFYPGGHGPMYDLAEDKDSQKIAAAAFDKGIIVAAVCHGPGALAHVKLADGSHIFKGRKATSFSNSEEEAVGLMDAVPFLPENGIREAGGLYEKAKEDWGAHVVVDGNLITGQNPASATPLGQVMIMKLAGIKQ
ncbi:MAG: putative chaperone protein HSP31 [Piptocephalis tieghemiana]|nr:MAG: putative chaperone protein HSP31 [Piptocephalis tieghemiana]